MRICFVGDSFVNGTGDPACLGWAGRICAAARRQGYDVTYYNLGVRRETSGDIRARWLAEVARRLSPDVDGRVGFSFGVNDTTHEDGHPRVVPETTLAHARAILDQARTRWPTLMVGPPPIGDDAQNQRIRSLSVQLGTLCDELDVPYLEVFATLRSSRTWMQDVQAGDGAHPGAAGYDELAGLVARWTVWMAWLANEA